MTCDVRRSLAHDDGRRLRLCGAASAYRHSLQLSGILEKVDLLIHSFTFRSNGDRMRFFVTQETSGGLHELPLRETFVSVHVDAKKIMVSWTADNAPRSSVFEKGLDPEDKIPAPRSAERTDTWPMDSSRHRAG